MDIQPPIINQTNLKVITKLKKSFVNDYAFWKTILESTNNAIQLQSNSLNLYNYDEFCIQFVKHLENKNSGITHKLIQKILYEMIQHKRS